MVLASDQDRHAVIAIAPGLRLRMAGLKDYETILDMSCALYEADRLAMHDRSKAALRNVIGNRDYGCVFLLEDSSGGTVLGQIIVCFGYSVELGGRDLLIEEIFIKPDHRDRGLGAMVIGAVEDWARQNGFASAFLEVMRGNPAEALYRRLGYGNRDSSYLSKSLIDEPSSPIEG